MIRSLATALVLLSTLSAAQAATPCGERDRIVGALGDKYGENRQALGLAGGARVFELFVSAKGTWTMIATDTRGLSCVVAAGDAWQADRKVVAGLES